MKSLNSLKSGPISTSALSSTLSSACVPHAFCIVCLAKKMLSAASKSNSPSAGAEARDVDDRYLKRNMTPYMGLEKRFSERAPS